MIKLMMMSEVLLSILMILLFSGSHSSWILTLNLSYERHWFGVGHGLLISMLEKLDLFHLISWIALVLLMWKWMVMCDENHFLRCLSGLYLENCFGALISSLLLKLLLKKWSLDSFYGIFFFLDCALSL